METTIINNKDLNSYLAGLIEGDGSIYYPGSSEKTHYSAIRIAGHTKDKYFFQWLTKKLNYGEIVKNNSPNSIVWRVTEKESLKDLCLRTKEYFRTPKVERMKGLCNYLEIKTDNIDTSDMLENAWLAGMADADSNFNVTLSYRKLGNKVLSIKRVQTQWRLEISYLNSNKESNMIWISQLSESLDSKLYFRSRRSKKDPSKNYEQILLVVFSEKSKNILENYLDKYKLLTAKRNDYEKWKKIRELNEKKNREKDNTKKLGLIQKIQFLKEKMNDKNIKPCWDHLNN